MRRKMEETRRKRDNFEKQGSFGGGIQKENGGLPR